MYKHSHQVTQLHIEAHVPAAMMHI